MIPAFLFTLPLSIGLITLTFWLTKINIQTIISSITLIPLIYVTIIDILNIFANMALVSVIMMSAIPVDTVSVYFLLFNSVILVTSLLINIANFCYSSLLTY